MTQYQTAIQRLKANDYRVVEGVETSISDVNKTIYLKVEVSPFSVYSNVEKIKMLLPDMDVRNFGTNSGVGEILIKSK